ncbi:hypothetical protein AV530_015699 [Patagioenas fasciata monilis]|uniref:Uncharacterized protein n=1 Tax=Patagioenas fasciata monilis TaxID=372326 RepID=A0A1V4KIL0_PATFA|nr:hypothetical protein AV530_015699 [Patagioenas fasciata monilis]
MEQSCEVWSWFPTQKPGRMLDPQLQCAAPSPPAVVVLGLPPPARRDGLKHKGAGPPRSTTLLKQGELWKRNQGTQNILLSEFLAVFLLII